MDLFSSDFVVMAALMLLGVFSLRQLIEADVRAMRARRRALKALAKATGGTYERVPRAGLAGDRVRLTRHGGTYLVYYEIVMAGDDASSYTRVQLLKPDPTRSFPSVTIVPEDFLERADNLLFGREERELGDPELDRRILVRAEPGRNLAALKSEAVVRGIKAFLEAGDWDHEFILESVPDQLRVSVSRHIDEPQQLEDFTVAAIDLLAALPTLAAEPEK